MKAFLLSDIHLGIHQLKVDSYLQIAKEYFDNFLFPLLIDNYKEGDVLFILGDLFDNRSHIDIKAICIALDIFKWFEQNKIKIEMIVGNHDLRGERSYEFNSLRILENFSNVTIYTTPSILEYGSKKILMMPYFTDVETEKEYLNKYQGKVNYLFCHSDLAGAKSNINSAPLTHGPSIADFVAYPAVYSGHIHLHQKMNNFTFIGCPYHLDRNDKGDKKGIYIIDIETGKEQFIINNLSPEYKSIDILSEDDIDKLDKIIANKATSKSIDDWYDITINNSLIMEKPELVRKLMDFSKKKSLTTIKQVDDIIISDTVEDVLLDDIGVSLSIPDMVRDYVKKQNFNDDVVKDKILEILEDVIQTCTTDKFEIIE